MSPIKFKKLTLSLCLCATSVLFIPSMVLAEETGPIAASKAADQKAALAKKAAEREKKAAEAKKAAETPTPNEVPTSTEEQKEK